MSLYDELLAQIEQLHARDTAGPVERRSLLLEIEKYISSAAYQSLPSEERARLQASRKELIALLQQAESEAEGAAQAPMTAGEGSSLPEQPPAPGGPEP